MSSLRRFCISRAHCIIAIARTSNAGSGFTHCSFGHLRTCPTLSELHTLPLTFLSFSVAVFLCSELDHTAPLSLPNVKPPNVGSYVGATVSTSMVRVPTTYYKPNTHCSRSFPQLQRSFR